MRSVINKRFDCRVCKLTNLERVFSFGPTPLANAFITKDQLDAPEAFYPLDVYFCSDCSMLQLGHVVSPTVLFSDYVYVSSTSPVFVEHFKKFADSATTRFQLSKHSLVIDIGSNDGILLKPFKEKGIRVLGIEPARYIAKIAKEKDGIETLPDFFSRTLAKKIAVKYGKATLITATNVFAHIDDLDEVIQGLDQLLAIDGVFMVEAPYLIDFLEKKYFDLVYHEHLSYWAVSPLQTLFNRFAMTIFDVRKVSSHGGSIQVFVKRNNGSHKIEKSVGVFLDHEKKMKLNKRETYLFYGKNILENKAKLIKLVTTLVLQNKKIIGFGAPAKGNTLLNYFKIGTEILSYIVDDSPYKQGLYTPGMHIPVVSPKKMKNDKVDYIMLLAWNFAESIMDKHTWFKEKGGKFIIPVPVPAIR